MARKTPEPLLVRHGTTAQAEATVGAPAELGADLQKKHIILYDGEKEGGYPAARADRKVSSATEGLTVNGGEDATLADDIELKDTRKWLKRADEIPEDTTELLADVPVGGAIVTPDAESMQFPYEYPGPYNDELWITESGEFTAPVTGEYEVTCIGGGDGAYWIPNRIEGGDSGAIETKLLRLSAGDVVEAIIGQGGLAISAASADALTLAYKGGYTAFGEITTEGSMRRFLGFSARNTTTAGIELACFGGGLGGAGQLSQALWYGAGGSGNKTDSAASPRNLTNGHQGAIFLRFFNPNKHQ